MTQDEIIEIASQVYGECVWHESALLRLERFVKLVAAKEREDCAKVCDKLPDSIYVCKVLKQAREALLKAHHVMQADMGQDQIEEALAVVQTALTELESREPVAWLLTEKNINSLQVDSIQLLIDRLKHAHHTDLCVRINGQDEWFQADWLKHMVRATPPQRTEERNFCPRCGKRTNDVHTCTPPMENT